MDFRFTQDESDVLAQAARTFRDRFPIRALLDGASRMDGWRAVAADGWLSASVAEDRGGAGLPLVLVGGVAREAGRALAGDGFVNNGLLIPDLLAGTDEHTGEGLVPGFLLVDGRDERLIGGVASETAPEPWCFGCEPGMAAYRFDGAYVERYGPDMWTCQPVAGLALGVGAVTLTNGAEPELRMRATPAEDLIARAVVVLAASLVGLAEAALQSTVEHVKARQQFGGPIGRFQAVKHGLADVYVQTEIAWNAVLYAALTLEESMVRTAQVEATAAAMSAVRAMGQFFGGIAMTWEHHAHLFMKSAEASVWRFGSADRSAYLLGAELIAETAP